REVEREFGRTAQGVVEASCEERTEEGPRSSRKFEERREAFGQRLPGEALEPFHLQLRAGTVLEGRRVDLEDLLPFLPIESGPGLRSEAALLHEAKHPGGERE